MWTQIRLLLHEQSDLGLHCLSEKASKTLHQSTEADEFCCDLGFKG